MALFEDEKPNNHATRLEGLVVGALKSAIDAHGPITKELIGSAAKRIVGQMRACGQTRVAIPVVTSDLLRRLEAIADALESWSDLATQISCDLAVLRDDNHPEGWSEVEFVETAADVPVAIIHHHRLQRAPRKYTRKRDGKTVELPRTADAGDPHNDKDKEARLGVGGSALELPAQNKSEEAR